MNILDTTLISFFFLLLLGGMFALCVFILKFFLLGVFSFRNHYAHCAEYYPRVAMIIPCWNEGLVIGRTVDIALHMTYPKDCLKIYTVDNASTDETPQILLKKAELYPERVIYLRKADAGRGKAHTLNFALEHILQDDWAQAIIIIDADVQFDPMALAKMTRHLADPQVGAVTAYIREASEPGTYLSRSIAFEYIVAQGVSRRIQNVLGALACLAGGAQLHSRENIELLGGKIDTSTLAEDTFTTLQTELNGKRALYEGNATVSCEEPEEVNALWKQRLRWQRGNIQITQHFKNVWFRHSDKHRVGGWLFGSLWFAILLMPIFMICTSIGLIGIFFISKHFSYYLFNLFYLVGLNLYLFTLGISCYIDLKTFKRVWFEAVFYPGLITWFCLIQLLFPSMWGYPHSLHDDKFIEWNDIPLLLMNLWIGLCLFAAWMIRIMEKGAWPKRCVDIALFIVGYGSLVCAMNLSALVVEWRKVDMQWNKTERLGRLISNSLPKIKFYNYQSEFKKDKSRERSILIIQFIIIVCLLRLAWDLVPRYIFMW